MRILKKQNGMSMIGWLITIGLIIAVSIPGIKIIPIYIHSLKINQSLKNLKSDLNIQANIANPEKIKIFLLDSLKLQQMPEITPDEITVTQLDDKYIVRITHQYQERIIQDRYFTLNIDKSVDIPSIAFKDR